MSSIINAGTSGLVLTGSTTTTLSLATNGTTRATIDASGNLGIGTAAPVTTFGKNITLYNDANTGTVASNSYFLVQSLNRNGVIDLASSATGTGSVNFVTTPGTPLAGIAGDIANSALAFRTGGNTERMRIDSSGNVGIGTASTGFNSAGLPLIVGSGSGNTGMTIFSTTASTGSIHFADTVTTGADSYRGYINYNHSTNSMQFGTDALERMRIDSSGNVGIGGTAAAYEKISVSGTYSTSSNVSQGFVSKATIPSGATSSFVGYYSVPSTQAASFTCTSLYHFLAGFGTKGASSAITSQYGFLAGSDLTGAANNYGFYSDIASGSNRWNFYAAGTANNFFAGGTGIGVFPTGYTNYRLSVQNTGATSAAVFISDTATTQTTFIWNQATSGNNVFAQFGTDGGATVRGSIDYDRAGGLARYNTTSDYRAKDVYGAWDDAGATIDALKVYRGKMHGATLERPMMIAHEAQEVAPYAVSGKKDAVDKDGNAVYQQMDHSVLVPLLIAELQAVRARLAALEAK